MQLNVIMFITTWQSLSLAPRGCVLYSSVSIKLPVMCIVSFYVRLKISQNLKTVPANMTRPLSDLAA